MSGFSSTSMWADMFALSIPILEKVLRPCLIYLFLVAGLRIFGKRELAQSNTFDLIVLLMLSNTVQNAVIGDDNTLLGGIIGALGLLAINYLMVRFLFRRPQLDRWLEGSPTRLIYNGHIIQKNLDHELITIQELQAAAHKQGFSDLKEIEQCLLETGGSFTFMAKDPAPIQTRYNDLVQRLEQIHQQLQLLQQQTTQQHK